jgi:hypothetical protein
MCEIKYEQQTRVHIVYLSTIQLPFSNFFLVVVHLSGEETTDAAEDNHSNVALRLSSEELAEQDEL